MQVKILVSSTLAALVAAGCASQQNTETAAAPMKKETAMAKPAAKPAKPKPKVQSGATDAMLSNTCAGCHGTNGISNGPATPTIAGLDADYFAETMMAYKNGSRHNTMMTKIAKGYTDGEIVQMANFFSKHSYTGWTQAAAGSKAKLGHKLHEAYCEKCHEDEGTSVEDIPMAGQWMPYIEWTVSDYLTGHNIPEKGMKKAVDKMIADHPGVSTAMMSEALSHYYGSRNAGYKRVPGRLK